MRLCGHIVNHTNAPLRQLRQRQAALIRLFEVAAAKEGCRDGRSVGGSFHCRALRSRRARFAFVTDQSDHSPDPEANLPGNAADNRAPWTAGPTLGS